MNKKEQTIEDVLNIVLEECGYSFRTIAKEDVLSKRGDLVLQMTRCIFVTQLMHLNYAKSIIAAYLGRTEQAIDDILCAAHEYKDIRRDWTYLMSEAEATKRCAVFRNVNNED